MSSQTQVRELFQLPKKEVIFDDFGCAYSKGILHQGRMYITENYICFYSSIMGISKKLIVPLNDVTKITKAKRLGLIKALMIYQANKKNPYQFQSFSDTDKTFSIIRKLWQNVSPYAEQDQATSEEDNDDLDNSTLKQGQSFIRGTEKATVVEETSLASAYQASPTVPSGDADQPQGVPGTLDARESLNQFKPEELKRKENSKEEVKGDLMSTTEVTKNAPSTLQVERAQGLTEIQQSTSKKELGKMEAGKDSKEEYIQKEELEKLLDAYPIEQPWELIEVIYLGFPAKDYIKNLQEFSSPNSFKQFFVERGEQKITTQDWAVPEVPEEHDGKPVLLKAEMFAEIQIKDNPFVKVSPTTKTSRILEQTDSKVLMRSMAKVKDVPLCDCFVVEEEYLVLSPSPTANCAVLRVMIRIIWLKNTLFKGKIQSNTTKATHQTYSEYNEWLKKRNLLFKEKKPQGTGKLKHGIEKSNKLFEKQVEQEAAVSQVAAATLKMKVIDNGRLAVDWAINYRTDLLLGLLLFFVVRVWMQLSAIQAQLAIRV